MKAVGLALDLLAFQSYGGIGTARVDRGYADIQKCQNCGAKLEFKRFDGAKLYIAGAGSKWPDILACDVPIFHERVVDCIAAEGLTGYAAHPAEMADIQNAKLAERAVPRYFLLEIKGRIDVVQKELDDFGGSVCPVCFARNCTVKSPYRWREKRIVFESGTWDGSDFVKTRNWRTGTSYCSKRFIDLAGKYHWSNFVFGSLRGTGLWGNAPEGRLSYYDPQWFEKICEREKSL